MTMTERVELWDAINRYAQACGGDTGQATVGSPRMQAVSDVEGLIKKLEHDRGSLHADSAVASLEAGRAEAKEEDVADCYFGDECGRLGCPNCQD